MKNALTVRRFLRAITSGTLPGSATCASTVWKRGIYRFVSQEALLRQKIALEPSVNGGKQAE